MTIHRDKYNIIGQIQPDGSIEGGDAACWNGHYIYFTDDIDQYDYRKTFEVGFGAYVRHPKPEMTTNGFGAVYKNPWYGCISRDQMIGILMALIKQKDYIGMLRLILHHSLRLFLFDYHNVPNGADPNTSKWQMSSITFAEIWSMQLRGFGLFSWIFWPILCIMDIWLLFSVLYDRYIDSSDNDVINFIGRLCVSREYVPTPVSWLAVKIADKESLLARMTDYWSGWRDSAGFVPLYKNKMDKLL